MITWYKNKPLELNEVRTELLLHTNQSYIIEKLRLTEKPEHPWKYFYELLDAFIEDKGVKGHILHLTYHSKKKTTRKKNLHRVAKELIKWAKRSGYLQKL
jgi:hypothetical protein